MEKEKKGSAAHQEEAYMVGKHQSEVSLKNSKRNRRRSAVLARSCRGEDELELLAVSVHGRCSDGFRELASGEGNEPGREEK
jgi:hypothetical protein